jgi:hypothetical protein
MGEVCCSMVMNWRDSDTVSGEKGCTLCTTQFFFWWLTCLLAMEFIYQSVAVPCATKVVLFQCFENPKLPSTLSGAQKSSKLPRFKQSLPKRRKQTQAPYL